MLKMKIYKLSNVPEDIFIIEYEFNDKFKSKRYYFLTYKQIKRIKNIDKLIEYCELNNIDLVDPKLSEKQYYNLLHTMYYLLSGKKNKFDDDLKQYYKNYNNKYSFENNLDENLSDYELELYNHFLKDMVLYDELDIKDKPKKR